MDSSVGLTMVEHRVYARIGFLGNPSDVTKNGGCVISFTIENFSAVVKLEQSQHLVIMPNPSHDHVEFHSLENLFHRIDFEGFYGGSRLLLSACRCFFYHCYFNEIALEEKQFTLSYETNIPRQGGLGGSTAIISAAVRCLIDYYRVSLSSVDRQKIIRHTEQELGIVAGPQDAASQDTGGLVFMDWEPYGPDGMFRRMDIGLLPPDLHLIYADSHVDSDMVLNAYHEEWALGFKHQYRLRLDDDEIEITDAALVEVAKLAREGFTVLTEYDGVAKVERLKELVNKNFDLRRNIYGDEYKREVEFVELARELGAAAKFTGGGMGVLVLGDPSQVARLQEECDKSGYHMVKVNPVNPYCQ